MGMSSGGDGDLNSEINVTPMVDVMLVLLIIFMVTAPLMNTGVDVELPAVTGKNIEDPQGKLILTIKKPNQLYLGKTDEAGRVHWKDLKTKLSTNEKVKKDSSLFIDADTNIAYGVVVTAMAIAKDAGVQHVMMLTDPTDNLHLDDLDRNPQIPGP